MTEMEADRRQTMTVTSKALERAIEAIRTSPAFDVECNQGATGKMRFEKGAFVRLLIDVDAEDVHIPAGTVCTIERHYPAQKDRAGVLDLLAGKADLNHYAGEVMFWVNECEVEACSMSDIEEDSGKRAFKDARAQFDINKTNINAARLLRSANRVFGYDLIGDEEFEGVLFDVIDYLEQ